MKLGSPERNGLVVREWKWCESKQQRTCNEVCQNNLRIGKCIQTKNGCKVKLETMPEETRVLLRSHYAKRGRPRKGSLNGKKTPELCEKVRKLGVKKVATMLYLEDRRDGNGKPVRDISENAVSGWIRRGTVPVEYHEAVRIL